MSKDMPKDMGASAVPADRAAGPADPSPAVSAKGGIPSAVGLQASLSANVAGEMLRELSFVGEYGCYSTFEVSPEYRPFKPEALGLSVRTALLGCFANTPPSISEIQAFAHPCGLIMAWHWDGDGTLVFAGPDWMLFNGDCKHDDEWERAEPGDWIDDYAKNPQWYDDPPAQGMVLREDSRSEAEGVAHQPGPATQDAPNLHRNLNPDTSDRLGEG